MQGPTEDIEFSDDIRVQELQSLQAIYPNCSVDYKHLLGSIEIPLRVDGGLEVRLFPQVEEHTDQVLSPLASHNVVNLPPIKMKFTLPKTYPYDEPPFIELESEVISPERLQDLHESIVNIWSDFKDQVLFTLVDYLLEKTQSSIEHLIPFLDMSNPEIFYSIMDYNQCVLQQEFDDSTFTCEICQDDYKGTKCSNFDICNHTFCNQCLFDFFTSVITSGDIDKVHCPSFECTKKFVKTKEEYSNLETWIAKDTKVEEIIEVLLTPSIKLALLTKILSSNLPPEEVDVVVKRYYELFKKSQYEAIGNLLPNRLVPCPRTNCNEVIFRKDLNDKLVICRRCSYAFCVDCQNSWHARFVVCKKLPDRGNSYQGVPVEDIEAYLLLEKDSYERKAMRSRYGRTIMARAIDEFQMDQMFNRMLKEDKNVIKCPNCECAIEKTDGCNKMKCSQCLINFCFVCGDIIGPDYRHFSESDSPCFKLLFFGMPGSEEN